MLALEKPVVGGEDEDRVVELAGLADRAVDAGDAAVDGAQGGEPAAGVVADALDATVGEGAQELAERGLVRDVALVE